MNSYRYITRLIVKHPKQEYVYYVVYRPKQNNKYLKSFRKEKDAIEYLHKYARENGINEFDLLK